MDVDHFSAGVPFLIGQALVTALQGWQQLQGASVLDNPVRASDLEAGERVVFVEDVADRERDQSGAAQKRTYVFNVGVINRSEAARLNAHGDYRAAKRCLLQVLQNLPRQLAVASIVKETDVTFRLENIDVGGSLVLGTFTVDYRDPS